MRVPEVSGRELEALSGAGPITFNDGLLLLSSGPMVRAILEGRKSQTRRVLTRSNSTVDGYSWAEEFWDDLDFSDGPWKDGNPNGPGGFGCGQYLHVPRHSDDTFHRVRSRWEPGDRLWVRETWRFWGWTEDGIPWIEYRADGEKRLLERATIPFEWGDRLADIWADLSTAGNCPADDNGEGFRACDKGWRPSIHMPRWASRLTLEVTGVRVERVREISEEDARAEGYVSRDGFLRGEWAQKYSAGNPWVWVIEFRRITE